MISTNFSFVSITAGGGVFKWLNSPIGLLTILIALAVVGVIIIMAVNEYFGKGFVYNVVSLIVYTTYLLVVINTAGSLFAWLVSVKWLATTVLFIIYVIVFAWSYKSDRLTPFVVGFIAFVGGIQGIYSDCATTVLVGGVVFCATLGLTYAIIEADKEKAKAKNQSIDNNDDNDDEDDDDDEEDDEEDDDDDND